MYSFSNLSLLTSNLLFFPLKKSLFVRFFQILARPALCFAPFAPWRLRTWRRWRRQPPGWKTCAKVGFNRWVTTESWKNISMVFSGRCPKKMLVVSCFFKVVPKNCHKVLPRSPADHHTFWFESGMARAPKSPVFDSRWWALVGMARVMADIFCKKKQVFAVNWILFLFGYMKATGKCTQLFWVFFCFWCQGTSDRRSISKEEHWSVIFLLNKLPFQKLWFKTDGFL